MYWLAKIVFENESDSGKITKVTEQYLVSSNNPTEVETKIKESIGDGVSDFKVVSISESKIIAIL